MWRIQPEINGFILPSSSHSDENMGIGKAASKCTHLAIEAGTLELVALKKDHDDEEGEEADRKNHGEQVQLKARPLGNAVLKLRNGGSKKVGEGEFLWILFHSFQLLLAINFSTISRMAAFKKQMNEAGQRVPLNLFGTKRMRQPKEMPKGPPSRLALIKSILEQAIREKIIKKNIFCSKF